MRKHTNGGQIVFISAVKPLFSFNPRLNSVYGVFGIRCVCDCATVEWAAALLRGFVRFSLLGVCLIRRLCDDNCLNGEEDVHVMSATQSVSHLIDAKPRSVPRESNVGFFRWERKREKLTHSWFGNGSIDRHAISVWFLLMNRTWRIEGGGGLEAVLTERTSLRGFRTFNLCLHLHRTFPFECEFRLFCLNLTFFVFFLFWSLHWRQCESIFTFDWMRSRIPHTRIQADRQCTVPLPNVAE